MSRTKEAESLEDAMVNPELLKILACPACQKGLAEEGEQLLCRGCGRRYPVRNGIPVMLVEEAQGGPQA